jgi:hypothetical protein
MVKNDTSPEPTTQTPEPPKQDRFERFITQLIPQPRKKKATTAQTKESDPKVEVEKEQRNTSNDTKEPKTS